MNYLNRVQCKILLVIISLIIVPQVFAQSTKSIFTKVNGLRTPVIHTDKRVYETGETVDIAGVEFLGYERVRLNVKYFDVNLSQELPLSTWDVYADGKGRIAGEWQVLDVGERGSRFIIDARGTISGASSKTEISTEPLVGEAVNLTQCANSNASPQNLDCPSSGSSGWISGNVTSSKAKYFEGNSIAYRNIITGLVATKQYKWTVRYDTSKSGSNAIDYLTTYNRTISNANPCRNGAVVNGFCTFASPTSTSPIPIDTNVTNGRNQVPGGGDDITQISGSITAWGANITAVSAPVYTGTFPTGDSSASVDITFTATAATAVIAWGGHIATRSDWGQPFGAITIGGSPYHTENGGLTNITDGTSCCTGTQALSLQAAAVAATARINIVKEATPPSTQVFGFTASPGLTPSAFNMTDSSSTSNPTQVLDNISTFDLKTITETSHPNYTVRDIVCSVDVGTGGTPPPVRTGDSIAIDIKSGDVVTCTFFNDLITAAAVSVSGRVFDSAGYGLPRAYVSVTDAGGELRAAVTNQFGYYTIDNLEAGDGYVFNVWHRSYTFPSRFINVDESLTNVNFHPE